MKTKFFHRIALSIALTIGASIAVAQTNVTTDVVTVNLQTDTVKVMSQKMNREIKAVVVLPHQYFDNPTDSFPSVYVLHGASGDYSNWPKKKNLEQVATQYGVVMICPDGQDSWYFDSPIDPKMQFETFTQRQNARHHGFEHGWSRRTLECVSAPRCVGLVRQYERRRGYHQIHRPLAHQSAIG